MKAKFKKYIKKFYENNWSEPQNLWAYSETLIYSHWASFLRENERNKIK